MATHTPRRVRAPPRSHRGRPSAASQRVVALLAIRGPCPRTVAAGILSPDVPERRALARIRTAVWRLRQAGVAIACGSRGVLALPPDLAVHVMDLASVCMWATHPIPARYGLLPGWFEDWVLMERELARYMVLHWMERAARDALDTGRPDACLQWGLAAVAIYPLRESANGLVVRAHLAEGNLDGARRQVDRLRARLLREVGVLPSGSLIELIESALVARRRP